MVHTSLFYKLVQLTERKMRSVAHRKTVIWLPEYQIRLKNNPRASFSSFGGESGAVCYLLDRYKMQDISKYWHLESKVTALSYTAKIQRTWEEVWEEMTWPGTRVWTRFSHNHRSIRLETTSKIIMSNLWLDTTMQTKPRALCATLSFL